MRDIPGELLKLATLIPEHGELLTAAAEELDGLYASVAMVKAAIKELPKGRQQ